MKHRTLPNLESNLDPISTRSQPDLDLTSTWFKPKSRPDLASLHPTPERYLGHVTLTSARRRRKRAAPLACSRGKIENAG